MGAQDGVDLALRAAHSIVYRYRRPDIGFVFVGSGDQFDKLIHLANELQLEQNVFFAVESRTRELVGYLSASDVCLRPDPKTGSTSSIP